MTRTPQKSDVPEGNQLVQMHNSHVVDVTAFLTEYAQLKRIVGDHDDAEKAETIRNNYYQQCGEIL